MLLEAIRGSQRQMPISFRHLGCLVAGRGGLGVEIHPTLGDNLEHTISNSKKGGKPKYPDVVRIPHPLRIIGLSNERVRMNLYYTGVFGGSQNS